MDQKPPVPPTPTAAPLAKAAALAATPPKAAPAPIAKAGAPATPGAKPAAAPGAQKPAAAPPAKAPAATAKPAAAGPAKPQDDGPVLEEPEHPFQEFLARKFDELVQAMTKEGARLKIHPVKQVRTLVTIMTVRVAAFAVRSRVERADVLKVLDHFWGLQPKPPPPAPK